MAVGPSAPPMMAMEHGSAKAKPRAVVRALEALVSKGKAQGFGPEEGGKNPDLRRRTQKKGLGFGQKGSKVGHGSNTHEDDGRKYSRLDTKVKGMQKTIISQDPREGKVYQNRAESDGDKQERFKSFGYGQVEQQASYGDHQQLLPGDGQKAGAFHKSYD